jgi:hypothetical protein
MNANTNTNTNTSTNTNTNINIKDVKKTSFWYGVLGGVVAAIIAKAIWYFIQRIIEG